MGKRGALSSPVPSCHLHVEPLRGVEYSHRGCLFIVLGGLGHTLVTIQYDECVLAYSILAMADCGSEI